MTVHLPPGPAAVVFDLDGVLIESEQLWEEMWTRYAAGNGVTWTAEDAAHVQGMSAPEWSAYLAERAGGHDDAATCERAVVDDMVGALQVGRMEPYNGAVAMVREVADRVPVALATSAPRRLIDAVLERNGLTSSFGATVSSAEVARGKPSPDVYLEAAGRLDADPERKARVMARTPMNRMGRPEEVAAAAVFLCSDAAQTMTGAPLSIDGGWVAQ